jgi:hypothetical protein
MMFRRGGLVKRALILGLQGRMRMVGSGGAAGVAVGKAGVARSPLRRSEARFVHGLGDARVGPADPRARRRQDEEPRLRRLSPESSIR